jgi:hypothetical protein
MASSQCLLRLSLAALPVAAPACGDQLSSPGDDDGPGVSDGGPGEDATEVPIEPDASVVETWGRLASPGHDGERIVATLFFAGEARDGTTRYEFPASSNMNLYTQLPDDDSQLRWSTEPASRHLVLDQMVETGVNVVYLSYWGQRGTDTWSRYAPMQSSTFAHDEVLSAIGDRPLMVVPFIESHSDWTFRGEFPGQPGFPSPGLVAQVSDLVERIVLEPADPRWPDLWAKVYGPDGEPRLAVAVIHASSDTVIDSREYVEGLDAAAAEIEAATGVQVGFLLDALPPGSAAPGSSFPTPESSAGPMSRSLSVLGISCFIPEIWVDFGSDPGDTKRLAWKRAFTAAWVDSGVPTLVDVTPGYDASLVFPGSVRFGHSLAWRDGLADLVDDFGEDGLVLNSWNGYTEAMVMVPTTVQGGTVKRWAEDLAASVTRPEE